MCSLRARSKVVIVIAVGCAGCGLFDPETKDTCVAPELCGPDATVAGAREACSKALKDPKSFSGHLVRSCQARAEQCDAGTAPKQWCSEPSGTKDSGTDAMTSRDAGTDAAKPGRDAGTDAAKPGRDAGTDAAKSPCGGCPAGEVCAESTGECVQCLDNSQCQAPKGVCDKTSGTCVACVGNVDCAAPTPVCVANTCLACSADSDCSKPTPACDTARNTCVACTKKDHCAGDTPLCDDQKQVCVACLSDSDCGSAAAAHCNEGKCEPCTDSSHCAHVVDLHVCDTSSGTGQCVECTGSAYDACGMNGGKPYVCDSLMRKCTTQQAGSALACEACVSDAHCRTGTLCMQTKFGGADTGNYCLWTKAWTGSGAPSGSCLNVRPYVGSESGWTSIDGQNATVCKPARTTCQGENDFLNKGCSGEGAAGDAQCGAEGVEDGYCAPFMGVYRCTVPCVAYDDCKATQQGANMECQQQTLGGRDVSVCQFQ